MVSIPFVACYIFARRTQNTHRLCGGTRTLINSAIAANSPNSIRCRIKSNFYKFPQFLYPSAVAIPITQIRPVVYP